MVEYWTIVDKFGRSNKLYRDGDTMPSLDTADRWDPSGAPHRVVHLVEAGTVEPELAEVVKAARTVVYDWWQRLSTERARLSNAIKKLKPHQLRACGIEVDDA